MPRVGSGIYEIPDGTHGVENTTIESAKYNSYVDDVAIDLNLARPIIAGGTGANNAADALVALKGEQTFQLVTNYDAHLFVSGSFYSTTATGSHAPVDGHAFVGICYTSDPPNVAGMPPVAKDLVIEARDQSDTLNPGRKYVRERRAGVWGAWRNAERDIYGDAEGFSSEAGDMFFGIKGVAPSSKFIINDKKDASGNNLVTTTKAGVTTIRVKPDMNAMFYEPSAGTYGINFCNDAAAVNVAAAFYATTITFNGACNFPTTPTAPAPAQSDNSTKVANTNWVKTYALPLTGGTISGQSSSHRGS